MMNRFFLGLILLVSFYANARAQGSSQVNTYYFSAHTITPSSPTTADSVFIYFRIEFPEYNAIKIVGALVGINDTFIYHGCYFNPGFFQAFSHVDDTLSLGKLSAGEHPVFIVARYALNSTDSACLTTNDMWNDTLHLVINVSEQTGVVATTATELCVSPNPATTQLIIQTKGAEIEEVNIYNTTGSLVMAVPLNTNYYLLNTEALAPGVYIAEVKTQQGSVRKRWVKM